MLYAFFDDRGALCHDAFRHQTAFGVACAERFAGALGRLTA